VSLLSLRRTSVALLASQRAAAERTIGAGETRVRHAVEAGQIGEWELDLDTDVSVRDLRHDQIFGYREPVAEWGIDTFMSHVLPEDRPATEEAFRLSGATGTGWNIQCRIRRADDGEVRWIAAYSAPQLDAGGRAIKLFGMV
jgi:PAS domain-containing protein